MTVEAGKRARAAGGRMALAGLAAAALLAGYGI